MANPYYPQSAGYNPYNPTVLYTQFPPPIQNPPPAPQPPPQIPQRPPQFPTAGHIPQPQSAQQPVAPRTRAAVNKLPMRQLLMNQQVMVHLQARGWVMGIVLATVELANAIMGWGYEVRYKTPETNSEEIDTFPHHSDSIRLP